jgi:murein DD-endopeptidase MepM/ murein hydrolase activator NlpD
MGTNNTIGIIKLDDKLDDPNSYAPTADATTVATLASVGKDNETYTYLSRTDVITGVDVEAWLKARWQTIGTTKLLDGLSVINTVKDWLGLENSVTAADTSGTAGGSGGGGSGGTGGAGGGGGGGTGTGISINNWSNTSYTGPFFAPVDGYVGTTDGDSIANGNYRNGSRPEHGAVDIYAATGTLVVAPVSGQLIQNSLSSSSDTGYRFYLQGDDGHVYWGCHMQYCATDKNGNSLEGTYVTAGTVIGAVDSTGFDPSTCAPHLHFETHPGSVSRTSQATAIPPFPFLNAVYPDGHNPVTSYVSNPNNPNPVS